jgi:hypothetical protein
VGTSSGFIDGGLAFDPISQKLFVGTANGLNSGLVEILDPITGVTQPFADGFNGSLGVLREPVSGDLYFLESNQLYRLESEFIVPEASSLTLLILGILHLTAPRRRTSSKAAKNPTV